MEGRAFSYIFSLIYPAILGTFLFAAFTRVEWPPVKGAIYLLMLVYFLVQYGEGLAAAKARGADGRYGPLRAVRDLAEVAAMVFVFASLGSFAPTADPKSDPPAPWLHRFDGGYWYAMMVAFAIPPVFRWARGRFGRLFGDEPSAREEEFGGYLSALSVVAILGCVAGIAGCAVFGLLLIGMALLIYVTLFVFLVDWTTAKCDSSPGQSDAGSATS